MHLSTRNLVRPALAVLSLTGVSAGIAAVTQLGSAQAAPCRVPSTPDLRVADIIRREGVIRNASPRVLLAAMEAAKVESNVNNVPCGDQDSLGVFQQRASWGTAAERMNPAIAAGKFFDPAIKLDGRLPASDSAGRLAQKVQRSAFPARYDQAKAAAMQLLDLTNSRARTGQLVNGGFEQGSQGWTPGNGAINFYVYKGPSDAHSGSGFLQVNSATPGRSIAQTVEGDPRGARTFTVWARCRAARCQGSIALWAVGPNRAGSKTFTVGSSWTKLSVTRPAIPGTTALRPEIYITSTGTNLDLDDATLTVPAQTPS